jgi:hypothetical protein
LVHWLLFRPIMLASFCGGEELHLSIALSTSKGRGGLSTVNTFVYFLSCFQAFYRCLDTPTVDKNDQRRISSPVNKLFYSTMIFSRWNYIVVFRILFNEQFKRHEKSLRPCTDRAWNELSKSFVRFALPALVSELQACKV